MIDVITLKLVFSVALVSKHGSYLIITLVITAEKQRKYVIRQMHQE